MTEGNGLSSLDLEALLSETLRPIEPPERLSGRLETTLSRLSEAAANELSAWSRELSEGELEALRDPRKWVRPMAAAAVGGVAGAGLIVFEMRRRRRQDGWRGLADSVRGRLS